MTPILSRWTSLGTRVSLTASIARILVYGILLFFAFECITINFKWAEQAVLGAFTVFLALILNRVSSSNVITLALMFGSMISTARYAYWRFSTLAETIATYGLTLGIINIGFMFLLVSAEIYAFVILYLGYIQTIRPLSRLPVPMPKKLEEWPHVDVLIPTYNESLSVVRPTSLAALNMDYPEDRLHVYVLDDGKREDFAQFCEKVNIGYITRSDNKHAKAGNINHALTKTNSPYVAIFDCDHVPTRSFMQMTLGWFMKDAKLGVMQTPHYFYSPDPFERNLNQFMVIPNEGELFYGVIQDGNDLWNATFFCGSCAVIRRTALDEIGGIATETVTEDAHTSLRMQTRGWNTAYINIPQAAGLATESLSGHIGQRIRWARGMMQILRVDNPLFAKGLKWQQKLCYFNAMIHFLYAMPRLVFITAPLVYMLFGFINIPGYWAAILVYSAPHLLLSAVTNLRIQGKHRYSFWNEVYEVVLAPYILGPTVLALINPKLGKFNVTAKGGLVESRYFDRRIARPYVALIWLCICGLAMAPVRLYYLNVHRPGTIGMNVFWILFNLVILGTANAVAIESRQLRGSVRTCLQLPVELRLPDGHSIFGESVDVSLGGANVYLDARLTLPKDSIIQVVYPLRGEQAVFPAQVVECDGTNLRLMHSSLSIQQEEALTLVLFSSADSWLSRNENREPDRPLLSFWKLMKLSVKGVGYALIAWIPRRKPVQAAAALVLVLLCGGFSAMLRAQTKPAIVTPEVQAGGSEEGSFRTSFTLKDIGVPEQIVFRGVAASRYIPFSLPQTQVVQQAELRLKYSFSPSLIAQMSHINVLLNGAVVMTLPVPQNHGEMQSPLAATIPVAPELLVRDNILGFEFVGHYKQDCEDPANTALWARVENSTSIQLSGSWLPLADDLKILPLPFYDDAVSSQVATIPFAFANAEPTYSALTAAGIVASWFGVRAKSRPLHFPVSNGTIPRGNVVLLVEKGSDMPPGIDLNVSGPVIAVRTNPNDSYGKLLIIAGHDANQLLIAARSLAIGNALLQGHAAQVNNFQLPDPRQADDAPLWMRTDRISSFADYDATPQLQSDGSGPLAVYLRVPPDLYYGDRTNLLMHLDYRYNAVSLANASTLRVSANGSMVNELPLPHENQPKKELSYDLSVPITNLRPFANTFLLNFYFQIAKSGNCQDTAPINLQGAVLKSSYLDLRKLNHWAALPNLELFANAGFPFTRFADLSQTRVILPPNPTPAEETLYLALMAYFGEQTGYPALRMTAGDSSLLGDDVDYLVLGKPGNQPGFERLQKELPITVREDGFTVQGTNGFFATIRHAWWQVAEMRPNWWWKLDQTQQRSGLLSSFSQPPDALIQGIESPWNRDRTVVAITYKDDAAAGQFGSAFWKSSASGDISESISVLHGASFSSYRIGDRFYHVGYLPWWSQVRYWLSEFPWVIGVLTFLLGLFIVPWLRAHLDRIAKDRLDVR